MREWAERNGLFVALDDHYDSVTFLEAPAAGSPVAAPRWIEPLDASGVHSALPPPERPCHLP